MSCIADFARKTADVRDNLGRGISARGRVGCRDVEATLTWAIDVPSAAHRAATVLGRAINSGRNNGNAASAGRQSGIWRSQDGADGGLQLGCLALVEAEGLSHCAETNGVRHGSQALACPPDARSVWARGKERAEDQATCPRLVYERSRCWSRAGGGREAWGASQRSWGVAFSLASTHTHCR